MTITIGFAQGGKIIQSKKTPAIQLAGNFAANLGPTILTKLRTEWDNPLQVGLLTKPPSPEGHSYEELAEEHYTRQPLLLTYDGVGRQTNKVRIAFGPMTQAWPETGHL